MPPVPMTARVMTSLGGVYPGPPQTCLGTMSGADSADHADRVWGRFPFTDDHFDFQYYQDADSLAGTEHVDPFFGRMPPQPWTRVYVATGRGRGITLLLVWKVGRGRAGRTGRNMFQEVAPRKKGARRNGDARRHGDAS